MSVFWPAATKSYLRRRAAAGFMDTCVRLVYATTDGDYGPGTVEAYSTGATLACLFAPRAESDAQGESEVMRVDADLWLPHTTTLLPGDRVTITHLHGDAVAEPQSFDIVAGPVNGKTMMHAELRLVTDGSAEE